ncbi:MAG: MFS transporter [Candidatus Kapabacteria bacterium]|nr:MFS transporter [Candidatus Kapabacteria bacterium]MCS7169339.1 MFS transporter [Candidatus Kapabacteria bacterium]MDW7996876.1 MFS transporter [Bacteroidota bacterium]MDW8225591.1 MFS transporter [Bacteroidota bacterium]
MRLGQDESGRRAAEQWVLAATVFVSFFDTFALLPVLPVYIKSLGAEAWQIGLVMSTYSLVGLLMQTAGGYVADVFGRKPSVVLSLFGAALALGFYGLAPSVMWLGVLRVFHGATGAFFLPSLFALVGERAGFQRAKAMGKIGALVGLAAVVAPPIGGMVARWFGAPALFASIAILMAVMALLVWRYIPETLTQRLGRRPMQLLTVLRTPTLVAVYALTASFTFCMGALAYGFPLLVVERGYTTAVAGQLLGWMALVAVPVMALLRWGRALERALVGLGLIAVCLMVLWELHSLWLLMVAMGIYGIGFGLVFPAVHVLTFDHAPASLRGSAFGLLYVFYSAGIIAGPIVAGLLSGTVAPGIVAAGVGGIVLLGVVGWKARRSWFRWVHL